MLCELALISSIFDAHWVPYTVYPYSDLLSCLERCCWPEKTYFHLFALHCLSKYLKTYDSDELDGVAVNRIDARILKYF